MAELRIGTVRFKNDVIVKYISPIGVYPANDGKDYSPHIPKDNINILQFGTITEYDETIGEWVVYDNLDLIESIDFYNENDEKLNSELFGNNYESRTYSILFRINPTDNIGEYNKIQARIKYRENSTDTDYLIKTSSYIDIKNPIKIITPLPNIRTFALDTEYPFEFEYTTVYLNKLNLEFSDYWVSLETDDYHFKQNGSYDEDIYRNPFISNMVEIDAKKLGIGADNYYVPLGITRRLRMNIRFSDRQTTNINLGSGTEEEPKILNLYNNYAPPPPHISKVVTDTFTVIIGESFDFIFYGVGELQGITKLELYNTNNELINCEFGDIPNFNLNFTNYYPISCTVTQENINENDSYYLKVYLTNGIYKIFNQPFKIFNEQNMGEIIAIGKKENTDLFLGTNDISTIWLTCTSDDTEVSFNVYNNKTPNIEDITFTCQSQELLENGNYYRVYGINVPQDFEYNEVYINAYNSESTSNVLDYQVGDAIRFAVPEQGTELVRGVEFDISFFTLTERNILVSLFVNNERVEFETYTYTDTFDANHTTYTIPIDYDKDVISIRISDGVNTIDKSFKIKAYEAPKIKTLSQSTNELPSGGGSVEINVEYENYDKIDTPSIYIDGEEKDYSLYLSPKSIVAGDIYNYVFNFPPTTKEQIITITLTAYLEGIKTNQSYTIKQNAPTGNPDIDNAEIKSELILSKYTDELNSNSQEYYIDSLINLPLNEEVGEVRATVSVDWLVVENDVEGVNDFQYYKELVNEWYVEVEQNDNEESRLAEITFTYYNTNGDMIDSKKFMLLQNGTLSTDNKEYRSVWEDIIFEVDADIFNYEVVMSVFDTNGLSNNTRIFEGRAYKYPDADTIKIKLNKIFENYLSNSFVNLINDYNIDDIINTSFNTDKYNYESCKRFYIINRDTNEVLGEYVVLYDWSYKLKWRGEEVVLSKPINNNNAVNQINLTTTVNKLGIVTNNITNENKINSCGDYAVYYLNSYGGWDTLLFNNKVNKSKNINYYTTEKYFRKPNVDFEQYRYISELQNSYELNTNFLTDIESQNMVDNLFVSNEVYLHNLKNNELFAVIITNTNIDYKIYSDGLELPHYTINVKESQIQLKR